MALFYFSLIIIRQHLKSASPNRGWQWQEERTLSKVEKAWYGEKDWKSAPRRECGNWASQVMTPKDGVSARVTPTIITVVFTECSAPNLVEFVGATLASLCCASICKHYRATLAKKKIAPDIGQWATWLVCHQRLDNHLLLPVADFHLAKVGFDHSESFSSQNSTQQNPICAHL